MRSTATVLAVSMSLAACATTPSWRERAVAIGSGGTTAPILVSQVSPAYAEGEQAGPSGDVYLEAVVTEEGTVVEPKVIRGLSDELDQRALDAVLQWKFEPGTKGGKPVPVIVLFTVTFRTR